MTQEMSIEQIKWAAKRKPRRICIFGNISVSRDELMVNLKKLHFTDQKLPFDISPGG